jgi:hypothetical protein
MTGHQRKFSPIVVSLSVALIGSSLSATASPVKPNTVTPAALTAPGTDPAVAQIPGAQAPETVGVLTSTTPVAPTIIVIDNDDENEAAMIEETYKWADVPDEPGKTKITTGATFPVKVVSELSSKTAKVGDPVEAQVRVDLKIGGKMIAPKGTRVVGHVLNVMPARRMLVAEVSTHRFWRPNGEIGIQFDEIITKEGERIPLEAMPAKQPRIVVNKAEGRIMGVNAKGEVASPLSIQLKEQCIHYAIRGAASAAGVFSFGAVPVAYAALGAINPSFAYMHPVGRNVPHRRLKGAAMGFVNGLPGGFLIADGIIRGCEASIKPGDEFLVQFKQDFTGEPASDAELSGGSKSVHGEVVGRHKNGKQTDSK